MPCVSSAFSHKSPTCRSLHKHVGSAKGVYALYSCSYCEIIRAGVEEEKGGRGIIIIIIDIIQMLPLGAFT